MERAPADIEVAGDIFCGTDILELPFHILHVAHQSWIRLRLKIVPLVYRQAFQ